MVDDLMARDPESRKERQRRGDGEGSAPQTRETCEGATYLLVWLKTKKARASGMGTTFSFS